MTRVIIQYFKQNYRCLEKMLRNNQLKHTEHVRAGDEQPAVPLGCLSMLPLWRAGP